MDILLVAVAAGWLGLTGQATGALAVPRQPTRPPLPATELDRGDSEATLDSPRHLSLTFAEEMPIRNVLFLLVRGTRFSISFDPSVRGGFLGEIKDLTLRQALDAVLHPLGLDFDLQGSLIRVAARRAETQLFDLNALAVDRGWSRTIGGGAGQLTARVPVEDVLDGISAGIGSLLSADGSLHVDRHAGVAQVTDFRDRLDRVGFYLETLQRRSSREVRLQGQILEVTLHAGPSIDWTAVRQRLGLHGDAALAGLAADPSVVASALAAQGDVRLISAPDLIALNNEPAMLRAGIESEAMLTLTVVPQIASDGFVQLSISPSWTEHAGDRTDSSKTSTPITRVAEADTVSRVMDGTTVAVGGMLRTRDTAASEFVVLLKPTIVAPAPIGATR